MQIPVMGRGARRECVFAPAEVKTPGHSRDVSLAMLDAGTLKIAQALCPDNPALLIAEAASRHCRRLHSELLEQASKAMAELSVLTRANGDRATACLLQGFMVNELQFSYEQTIESLRKAADDLGICANEKYNVSELATSYVATCYRLRAV